MARLYEWEDHLTEEEAQAFVALEEKVETYRLLAKEYAADKDSIRRKAMQRARNALNKQARAAMKEKGNV